MEEVFIFLLYFIHFFILIFQFLYILLFVYKLPLVPFILLRSCSRLCFLLSPLLILLFFFFCHDQHNCTFRTSFSESSWCSSSMAVVVRYTQLRCYWLCVKQDPHRNNCYVFCSRQARRSKTSCYMAKWHPQMLTVFQQSSRSLRCTGWHIHTRSCGTNRITNKNYLVLYFIKGPHPKSFQIIIVELNYLDVLRNTTVLCTVSCVEEIESDLTSM